MGIITQTGQVAFNATGPSLRYDLGLFLFVYVWSGFRLRQSLIPLSVGAPKYRPHQVLRRDRGLLLLYGLVNSLTPLH